jgi:hypothetical protein
MEFLKGMYGYLFKKHCKYRSSFKSSAPQIIFFLSISPVAYCSTTLLIQSHATMHVSPRDYMVVLIFLLSGGTS